MFIRKFIFPKSLIRKIVKSIFGDNVYSFFGLVVMLTLFIGYLFVSFNYQGNYSFLTYKLDSSEKLAPPFLFNSQNESKSKSLDGSGSNFLFDNSNSSVENLSTNGDSNFNNKLFLLGTNSEGRDLFTYLFLGFGIYIIGGFIALLVSLIFGTILGSMSAYFEPGLISNIAKFIEDIINSFPKIIILFLALILFGVSLYPIMITIGIINSTNISKALYQKIKYLKNNEFIDSARQLGLNDLNILIRHILYYNCRDIFIVYGVFVIADAILLESTLAYLNFGIDWNNIINGINVKSWGTYLAEGKEYILSGKTWITIFPAIFLLLLLMSLNFIGEELKKRFHVK